MKKVFALILCLVMVAAVAVTAISAEEEIKPIDGRELEAYGQQHFWLGGAVDAANTPDVTDGVVDEEEYVVAQSFDLSDPTKAKHTDSKTGGFLESEGGAIYMSHDGEKLYIAVEVLDHNYYADKDYVMFQICGKDGGRTVDAVSRLQFCIRGDVSNGVVLSGEDVKTSFTEFVKNDDGTWAPKIGVAFDDFVDVENKSISYNEETEILTCEMALNLADFLEFWGNEQAIEDARLYIFLTIQCRGDSAEGAADGPLDQGYIWYYMNSQLDPMLKLQFTMDYPESTYFMEFFPHIIHFTDKPAETTTAPVVDETTAPVVDETTAPVVDETTAPVVDETTAPVVDETTAPVVDETTAKPATTTAKPAATTAKPAATTAAEEEGGCGSAIALSALAIVPMLGAAVVLGKKKED